MISDRIKFQLDFWFISLTADISRNFAVAISSTAKQLDVLIGALPEEEAGADIQRATVQKLLEAYRTEGVKLTRITNRLESRSTENFMDTKPDPLLFDSTYEVPDSLLPSSSKSPPISHVSWLTYLTVIFLVILFFRVCFSFGAVDRLHSLLNFILTIATSSGRRQRALRKMCATELEALRNQIKTVHMVDNFATYSKLERKIKALERQLRDLAPETLVGSVSLMHF
ncbi:unnamed protein product [Trichobilharzia regenti]|nr:unnamed protein product [Trichobilharzia regenti]